MNEVQVKRFAELWAVDPGEKMLVIDWRKQIHGIIIEAIDFEKEKPRDGIKLIEIFLGQIEYHIVRLAAAIMPPYAPPPQGLPDGFESEEDYIQLRQNYYSHSLNCHQYARDRLKAELIEQMLDYVNLELLSFYFPDSSSIAYFHKVLNSCFLLDGKGKLIGRKTLQLKEVLRAACKMQITIENYFILTKSKQMSFVGAISSAYGFTLNKRSLIDAFNKNDSDTYLRALAGFS